MQLITALMITAHSANAWTDREGKPVAGVGVLGKIQDVDITAGVLPAIIGVAKPPVLLSASSIIVIITRMSLVVGDPLR